MRAGDSILRRDFGWEMKLLFDEKEVNERKQDAHIPIKNYLSRV